MRKILIVEDDRHILTGIVDNLEAEGYKTITAQDGEAALKQVKDKEPDLIILDVMLPKLSGLDVCRELKKNGVRTPIIILSAKAQESDKVLGLELGADDYVTKPFSPRELLVRVKVVLRRLDTPEPEEVASFGDITVDFRRMQVFRGPHSSLRGANEVSDEAISNEIKLTAAEFKILKLLIASKGEPISRHKILKEIWTDEVTTRTVDTHIWSLREKLEDDPSHPKHILTVHRIGYKFI